MNEQKTSLKFTKVALIIHILCWIILGFHLLIINLFGDAILEFRIGKSGVVIFSLLAIVVSLLPLLFKFLKYKRAGAIIALCATLLYLVVFCVINYESRNYLTHFSAEKWQTLENYRLFMADDLIDSKVLIGKTKTEVKELLGEPDSSSDNMFVYYLAKNGRTHEFLEVTFSLDVVVKVGFQEIL